MKNQNDVPLMVINKTLEILNKPENWKRDSELTESCNQDDNAHSLGCSLKLAQLNIRGEKLNRSKEMGTIRRIIYFNYLWRAGIHPITYFNRHRKTTYDDIMKVLLKAKDKLSD